MEDFKKILLAELAPIDKAIEDDLITIKDSVDPLLNEVLRYSLFNGGKRVRPLLVLLAARFCGVSGRDAYTLGIAFEYLHVATLLHDDVIDRAATRRGKPSVNEKYGLVAAILTGDYLHARSMTLVGELSGTEGLKLFTEATQGMVDGEFVQLRNQEQYDLSQEKYFDAIKGKTAQLISAACEVGCVFAGGDIHQQDALRVYGSNLGAAFQIVDDLLDYLGDAAKTGKNIGNDLVEGKVTLPLILALKNAREKDRQELLELLENEERRKDSFAEVVDRVTALDGFSGSRIKAEELISEALQELDKVTCLDEQAAAILKGLAMYVLSRNK